MYNVNILSIQTMIKFFFKLFLLLLLVTFTLH